MCKRLFKVLKIKMDNYHLRYELAGANEEIVRLSEKIKEKDKHIAELKKANDSFSFIGYEIMKLYNKTEICNQDVENFIKQIEEDNDNGKRN